MDKKKQYPISEIFTSPQGEGQYTGCMMTFIRLAGCSVGKPFPKEEYDRGLPSYTEQCTLYDGRSFCCDTDYHVKERLTIDEILSRIPMNIQHACISGGEPFIHNLSPLCLALIKRGLKVHIETSGTIPKSKAFPDYFSEDFWITVSPKQHALAGEIASANEIKLLVDKNFDIHKVPESAIFHPLVYIQPVNGEHSVNAENLKLVMTLQEKYPNFRVSLQLHKVIESFIKERVR